GHRDGRRQHGPAPRPGAVGRQRARLWNRRGRVAPAEDPGEPGDGAALPALELPAQRRQLLLEAGAGGVGPRHAPGRMLAPAVGPGGAGLSGPLQLYLAPGVDAALGRHFVVAADAFLEPRVAVRLAVKDHVEREAVAQLGRLRRVAHG